MTNNEFLQDVGTNNQKENKVYNIYMNEFYSYGLLKSSETKRGYIEFLKGKKVYITDGINNIKCNLSDKVIDKENNTITIKLKKLFTYTGQLMIPINDQTDQTVIAFENCLVPGRVVLFYTN